MHDNNDDIDEMYVILYSYIPVTKYIIYNICMKYYPL